MTEGASPPAPSGFGTGETRVSPVEVIGNEAEFRPAPASQALPLLFGFNGIGPDVVRLGSRGVLPTGPGSGRLPVRHHHSLLRSVAMVADKAPKGGLTTLVNWTNAPG